MIFQDRFVRKISAQDYLQLSLKFNMMLQKKKKIIYNIKKIYN